MSAQGAPLPVRSDRRWEKVVSVERGEPLLACLLNPDWFGLWVHWDRDTGRKGQNVPCNGVDVCKLCLPPACLAPRWCAYIGAFVRHPQRERRGVRVLALTEGLCRQLLPYCDHSDGLTGLEVRLVRSQEKDNGRVFIDKAQRRSDDVPAPAFDIIPSLCRFYGVRSLHQLDSFRRQAAEHTGGDNEAQP